MINRLNPLLNTSKRKGYFKRSFIEKKEDEGDYWEDVEDTFRTELYTFGDTKTIYHIGKRDWVKRYSLDGREAMDIQFQRKFNTWVKEKNIKNRKNEWKEDREAFYADITGLRKYKMTGSRTKSVEEYTEQLKPVLPEKKQWDPYLKEFF